MFGPGLDGNRPRCAPFWDDFFACVVRVGRNDQWVQCQNFREDYLECLHHKKLYTRVQKFGTINLIQRTCTIIMVYC
ncbi:hypothetical protein ACROYT_G009088 [Oculina patagonica]